MSNLQLKILYSVWVWTWIACAIASYDANYIEHKQIINLSLKYYNLNEVEVNLKVIILVCFFCTIYFIIDYYYISHEIANHDWIIWLNIFTRKPASIFSKSNKNMLKLILNRHFWLILIIWIFLYLKFWTVKLYLFQIFVWVIFVDHIIKLLRSSCRVD